MKINTQRLKRRWKYYVAYIVIFILSFTLFYAYDHAQDQSTEQMLEDIKGHSVTVDDSAVTSIHTEKSLLLIKLISIRKIINKENSNTHYPCEEGTDPDGNLSISLTYHV